MYQILHSSLKINPLARSLVLVVVLQFLTTGAQAESAITNASAADNLISSAKVWNNLNSNDLGTFLDNNTTSVSREIPPIISTHDKEWSSKNDYITHSEELNRAPVPEAGNFAMMLSGLALIGIVLWRRKSV